MYMKGFSSVISNNLPYPLVRLSLLPFRDSGSQSPEMRLSLSVSNGLLSPVLPRCAADGGV